MNTFRLFRITIINAVKYVTSGSDYERRINSAIRIQAGRMRCRAEFLLTPALRRTGWKEPGVKILRILFALGGGGDIFATLRPQSGVKP